MPVVFRTKVDLWLVAVIVVAFGFGLWATMASVRQNPGEGWIGLVVMIGAMGLVMGISVPTEYIVTDRELVIRSGVLRSTIPLDSILRVYRTHNPLSAPAWSLDRIGIDYRSGRARRLALISPRRQADFLSVLQQRVPLEVAGSALVRRT